MRNSTKKKISLWGAISIGIGGMVGGGIFAVLGLAVGFAKGGTPIAFTFAGVIALITAYSYSKLSVKYPSKGGTVKFINKAFGQTIFSGSINTLLWISYIIMLSLYSTAFGSYAASLLPEGSNIILYKHIFTTVIIIIATGLNYFSVRLIGRTETFVVFVKLLILTLFVIFGLTSLSSNPNVSQLLFSHWSSIARIIAGGMVIFVAYEGFELIANTALDIENPKRNLPKAYYSSVCFVILLYILVAIVSVGSLAFPRIEKVQDYVLAEVAKPFFGQIGYILIAITAMLSTFSAINATLYGGSRVNYEIAEDDELPHGFTKYLWNEPIGLMITAVLTLIIANLINLESISTSGSVGFLLIFAGVNYANFKLHTEANSNKVISFSGFVLCMLAVIVLMVQQFITNLLGAIVAGLIVVVSVIIEVIYKEHEKRISKKRCREG
ncbi:APC family permease [candidate division WOR-3 bacterium]|nr:APC family permease [candidate division WOR-3 bacterium]